MSGHSGALRLSHGPFWQESLEQDFASMHLQALAPCAQLPTAPGGPAAQRPQELGMRASKDGRVKDVLKVATRAQLPTADTLQTLNAMVERRYGPCNK